jgi:glutamate N-acetyltransferase / amino-acid N-acetyltransferase
MARNKLFKRISGSICAPLGFKAAAVFCDIKTLGTGKGLDKGQKPDLAIIVSDVPAAVAGMFTTNQVCAAPVKLSGKRAMRKSCRGIVVNSGNANACTGRQGMRDAEEMTRVAGEAVAAVYGRRNPATPAVIRFREATTRQADRRYRKIGAEDILVCSTGRIGVPMPMKNVWKGIRDCAPRLARTTKHAREVAEAIMTTDTRRKEIAVEFHLGSVIIRIGGVCKGAGMIQPGMSNSKHATMLALITTDALISSAGLRQCLTDAVAESFNRITVDGDMSTNDSVITLANGLARNRIIRSGRALAIFRSALNHVCLELAKMIVHDGEGVTRFVTVRVRGARSSEEARNAARAIANSSLVRTSWCGGDPNWGRILCALGYSRAKVNESVVDIGYTRPADRAIAFAFRRGQPANTPFRKLATITAGPEFDVHVHLHSGPGESVIYASDLTEDYVTLNKGDVNDPRTLGG